MKRHRRPAFPRRRAPAKAEVTLRIIRRSADPRVRAYVGIDAVRADHRLRTVPVERGREMTVHGRWALVGTGEDAQRYHWPVIATGSPRDRLELVTGKAPYQMVVAVTGVREKPSRSREAE